MATAWLEKMKGNRPLRKRAVEIYADEMLAGRWQVNSQSIAVGKDGNVVDGQHRLAAVEATGLAVDMTVMFDAPDERAAVESIDCGLPRPSSDVVHFNVPDSEKPKAKAIANIISAMVRYNRPDPCLGKILPSRMRDLQAKYGQHAAFALDQAGNNKSPTTSAFLAVVARADFHRVSQDVLSGFVLLVKTNTPIERAAYEDTALALGSMLREEKVRPQVNTHSAMRITQRTERALLAYSRCERMTRITASKTNPWPLVK